MTLFNDEEEKPEKTKLQRWLSRIFYGVLICAAFVWISLRMLMNLGGNSEPLRQGLEEAIARATGLQTKIYQFNGMKFFPDVSIDAANVALSEPASDGRPSSPLVTIGTLKTSISFWAVFFSRYEVRELVISDIDIKENSYLTRPLHIDTISLEKNGLGPGQAAWVIKGLYGGDAFHGSVSSTWTAVPGRGGYFSPAEKSHFSLESRFLTMQGILSPDAGNGTHLLFDSIGTPENLLAGNVDIGPGFFDAALKGGGGEFDVKIKHDNNAYTGSLSIPSFDIADGKIMTAAGASYDFAMALVWDALARKDTKIDFDVQANQLVANGIKLGSLSFPIHAAARVLTAGPLSGEIAGGAATGQLTLDSSKNPLSLKINAVLRNTQYGILQHALIGKEGLPGQATIEIMATSEAAASDLMKNFKGEAAIVGGAGEIAVSVLDKAAPGLSKNLLPQTDPQSTMHVNCLLTDFRIKDSVASADPLLLEANEAAISGSGSINLAGKTIDLTLTPKPGKPARTVATHLSGSLENPVVQSVSASAAFPGKVTPSFLSFSMTDLGLDDKHPCNVFIGKAAP